MKKVIIVIASLISSLVLLAIVLFILLMFMFLSWRREEGYEYMNDASEIESIKIVELEEYVAENDAFDEKVIAVVDEQEMFLNELNRIECNRIIGLEPGGVHTGDTVIKITYKNGEYELIDYNGQGKYRHFDNHPSNFDAYSGFHHFEKVPFKKLILRYSES